jgi:hypothetical protein
MIHIKSTPGISHETWLAVSTDVSAAIDASLKKYGLSGERSGDAVERWAWISASDGCGSWESDQGHTGIRPALTAGSIAFTMYSTPSRSSTANLLLRFDAGGPRTVDHGRFELQECNYAAL